MHQLQGIPLDIPDIRVQLDTRDILRVLLDLIQALDHLRGLMDILQ